MDDMNFGIDRSSFQDTAQICLNGHLINHSFNSQPVNNKKYCPDCGEETTTKCPSCNTDIPGEIHYANVSGAADYTTAELFCSECGKPYPWTLKRIKAAKDMASELKLSSEDVKTLETSIEEIAKNNPQSTVGATRFKRIMSQVGGTAGDMLKEIVTEVASATAKKVLLGA